MKRKPPKRKPNCSCDLCGTDIYRRPSTLARNAGKFCSRSCRNKAYPLDKRPEGSYSFPKGKDNPAWKGGITYKRPKGNYKGVRYVRCPPEWIMMARKDGYIMEHRLMMAQMMGRPLIRKEVVHHIDHNPLNNKKENLMLFPSNGAHKRYEWQEISGKVGAVP